MKISFWPRDNELRKRIQKLIETKEYSWTQKIYLAPLFGLSLLYLIIGRWREGAYQVGLFGKAILPCPVICVGNITVGGTGKTPTVELVCRTLLNKGVKVSELLKFKKVSYDDLVDVIEINEYPDFVKNQIETMIKYEVFIDRERTQIEKFKRLEGLKIS